DAKEFDRFLRALLACGEQRDAAVHACLALVIDKATSQAKAWAGKAIDADLKNAIERAQQAGAFFQTYVTRLQQQLETQAIAATKCR
ncbi:MAG: hypothetical protein NT062_20395, partial [Proteobacteria bacterium]|nr:hypothetical protein [Pseudomonadota bacterium]